MKDLKQLSFQKTGKDKTVNCHSDDLSALMKNNVKNDNNGPITGQKTFISNNDDGNNIPVKVPCCQYPAKILPHV